MSDPEVIIDTANLKDSENLDDNFWMNPLLADKTNEQRKQLMIGFLKKELINQLIDINKKKSLEEFENDKVKNFFNNYEVFNYLAKILLDNSSKKSNGLLFKTLNSDKLLPKLILEHDILTEINKSLECENATIIYKPDDSEAKKTLLSKRSDKAEILFIEKQAIRNQGVNTSKNMINKILNLYQKKNVISNKTKYSYNESIKIKSTIMHIFDLFINKNIIMKKNVNISNYGKAPSRALQKMTAFEMKSTEEIFKKFEAADPPKKHFIWLWKIINRGQNISYIHLPTIIEQNKIPISGIPDPDIVAEQVKKRGKKTKEPLTPPTPEEIKTEEIKLIEETIKWWDKNKSDIKIAFDKKDPEYYIIASEYINNLKTKKDENIKYGDKFKAYKSELVKKAVTDGRNEYNKGKIYNRFFGKENFFKDREGELKEAIEIGDFDKAIDIVESSTKLKKNKPERVNFKAQLIQELTKAKSEAEKSVETDLDDIYTSYMKKAIESVIYNPQEKERINILLKAYNIINSEIPDLIDNYTDYDNFLLTIKNNIVNGKDHISNLNINKDKLFDNINSSKLNKILFDIYSDSLKDNFYIDQKYNQSYPFIDYEKIKFFQAKENYKNLIFFEELEKIFNEIVITKITITIPTDNNSINQDKYNEFLSNSYDFKNYIEKTISELKKVLDNIPTDIKEELTNNNSFRTSAVFTCEFLKTYIEKSRSEVLSKKNMTNLLLARQIKPRYDNLEFDDENIGLAFNKKRKVKVANKVGNKKNIRIKKKNSHEIISDDYIKFFTTKKDFKPATDEKNKWVYDEEMNKNILGQTEADKYKGETYDHYVSEFFAYYKNITKFLKNFCHHRIASKYYFIFNSITYVYKKLASNLDVNKSLHNKEKINIINKTINFVKKIEDICKRKTIEHLDSMKNNKYMYFNENFYKNINFFDSIDLFKNNLDENYEEIYYYLQIYAPALQNDLSSNQLVKNSEISLKISNQRLIEKTRIDIGNSLTNSLKNYKNSIENYNKILRKSIESEMRLKTLQNEIAILTEQLLSPRVEESVKVDISTNLKKHSDRRDLLEKHIQNMNNCKTQANKMMAKQMSTILELEDERIFRNYIPTNTNNSKTYSNLLGIDISFNQSSNSVDDFCSNFVSTRIPGDFSGRYYVKLLNERFNEISMNSFLSNEKILKELGSNIEFIHTEKFQMEGANQEDSIKFLEFKISRILNERFKKFDDLDKIDKKRDFIETSDFQYEVIKEIKTTFNGLRENDISRIFKGIKETMEIDCNNDQKLLSNNLSENPQRGGGYLDENVISYDEMILTDNDIKENNYSTYINKNAEEDILGGTGLFSAYAGGLGGWFTSDAEDNLRKRMKKIVVPVDNYTNSNDDYNNKISNLYEKFNDNLGIIESRILFDCLCITKVKRGSPFEQHIGEWNIICVYSIGEMDLAALSHSLGILNKNRDTNYNVKVGKGSRNGTDVEKEAYRHTGIICGQEGLQSAINYILYWHKQHSNPVNFYCNVVKNTSLYEQNQCLMRKLSADPNQPSLILNKLIQIQRFDISAAKFYHDVSASISNYHPDEMQKLENNDLSMSYFNSGYINYMICLPILNLNGFYARKNEYGVEIKFLTDEKKNGKKKDIKYDKYDFDFLKNDFKNSNNGLNEYIKYFNTKEFDKGFIQELITGNITQPQLDSHIKDISNIMKKYPKSINLTNDLAHRYLGFKIIQKGLESGTWSSGATNSLISSNFAGDPNSNVAKMFKGYVLNDLSYSKFFTDTSNNFKGNDKLFLRDISSLPVFAKSTVAGIQKYEKTIIDNRFFVKFSTHRPNNPPNFSTDVNETFSFVDDDSVGRDLFEIEYLMGARITEYGARLFNDISLTKGCEIRRIDEKKIYSPSDAIIYLKQNSRKPQKMYIEYLPPDQVKKEEKLFSRKKDYLNKKYSHIELKFRNPQNNVIRLENKNTSFYSKRDISDASYNLVIKSDIPEDIITESSFTKLDLSHNNEFYTKLISDLSKNLNMTSLPLTDSSFNAKVKEIKGTDIFKNLKNEVIDLDASINKLIETDLSLIKFLPETIMQNDYSSNEIERDISNLDLKTANDIKENDKLEQLNAISSNYSNYNLINSIIDNKFNISINKEYLWGFTNLININNIDDIDNKTILDTSNIKMFRHLNNTPLKKVQIILKLLTIIKLWKKEQKKYWQKIPEKEQNKFIHDYYATKRITGGGNKNIDLDKLIEITKNLASKLQIINNSNFKLGGGPNEEVIKLLINCDSMRNNEKVYYISIKIKNLFGAIKPEISFDNILEINEKGRLREVEDDTNFSRKAKNLLKLFNDEPQVLTNIKKSIKSFTGSNSMEYLTNKLKEEESSKTTAGGSLFGSNSSTIKDKTYSLMGNKNKTYENSNTQDQMIMVEIIYYLTYGVFNVFTNIFNKSDSKDPNNPGVADDEKRKQMDVFFKQYIPRIINIYTKDAGLINNNSITYLQIVRFLLDYLDEKLSRLFKSQKEDNQEDIESSKQSMETKLLKKAKDKKFFNALVFFNTYNKKISDFIVDYLHRDNFSKIRKIIKSSTDIEDRIKKIIASMDQMFTNYVYDDSKLVKKDKKDKKFADDNYNKVMTTLFSSKNSNNFNIKKINSKRFDQIIDDSLNLEQLMFNLDNIIKEIFGSNEETLLVDTEKNTLCLHLGKFEIEPRKLTETEKEVNKSKIDKLEKELEMLKKLE